MPLYRFYYDVKRYEDPTSHLKRTWACTNMAEAKETALTLNSMLKHVSVRQIEDIDSGETERL